MHWYYWIVADMLWNTVNIFIYLPQLYLGFESRITHLLRQSTSFIPRTWIVYRIYRRYLWCSYSAHVDVGNFMHALKCLCYDSLSRFFTKSAFPLFVTFTNFGNSVGMMTGFNVKLPLRIEANLSLTRFLFPSEKNIY